METSKFMVVFRVMTPMLLAACSAANNERVPSSDSPNSDNSGGFIEDNAVRSKATATPPASSSAPPAATTVSAGRHADTASGVRVPEDVLRSPLELMTLMQQMRSQIVYKTNRIPEAEYEQLVRPSLVTQLRTAGFAQNDVDEILSDVDYSRSLQGIH
jgi:hypothetical protein